MTFSHTALPPTELVRDAMRAAEIDASRLRKPKRKGLTPLRTGCLVAIGFSVYLSTLDNLAHFLLAAL